MSALDKIIGYTAIKEELKRYLDILKNIEKYEKFGVKQPSGILLFGEPGIGKSLMAKCLIEDSGRKFYVCRKDKPDGDFVNEIRNIFKKATENAPSIVFFDDIDKFSNSDFDHTNTEEFVTIQSCIDEVKDKNVFVLATANDYFLLPKSLRRVGRFDKIIEVENPIGEDAGEIFEYYLKQKNYPLNFDIKEISNILEGRSCAQIEAIVNDAGMYAAYKNQNSIKKQDMIDAYVRVMFNSTDMTSLSNEKDYELSAIHEAGHAVVAEVLNPEIVSLVTIDINSYRTGGVTAYNSKAKLPYTFENKENRIRTLLGGKAATEVVKKMIDTGVSSDVREAFRVGEDLADDYCVFGFDKSAEILKGESLQDRRDKAIADRLEKYYLDAKQILIENREFLDKVIEALLDKKTLLAKDIQDIKKLAKSRGSLWDM